MKKFFIFIFFSFLSVGVFAHTGIMAGQKNIKIVRTKYFDVIYAKGSEKSAEVIYRDGDDLYKALAEELGLKHEFRLPVVISPAQDEFNAYFSSAPFNHIVMFDTVCTESIAVFTEQTLMTFKHELTHAITYNLRNGFWFGLDCALGDIYNPALATVTIAWAEGAAVSLESEWGEGRVNDSYAVQMLKQAKLEGKFPNYGSVQGARDIYPFTTASYMFGGVFNYWLQKKYGMEKYAQFWYRCVNFKSLTYIGAFKKVYGVSIKNAWKEFMDSIEIPEARDLEAEGIALAVSGKNGTGRKVLSNYRGITSWKGGYAYYDANSCKVVYVDAVTGRSKCLHKTAGVKSLGFSKDGRFLVETYSWNGSAVPKNRIQIYDLFSKKIRKVSENSLRDGTIICDGEKYYLAAVKTESAFCTLKIWDIGAGEKISSKPQLVYEEKFGAEQQVFSAEGSDDGKLYFILKNGLVYSIRQLDLETKFMKIWAVPDKMVVQKLNILEDTLSFSYAKKDCFPRLGFLNVSDGTFSFQNEDVLGGVYNPVAVGYKDSKKIIYYGNFFQGHKLLESEISGLNFENISAKTGILEKRYYAEENYGESSELLENSKKFNSFTYNFTGPHGVIIPLGMDSSYSIKTLDKIEALPNIIGATYITSTPWTNPILICSTGYNPNYNSWTAAVKSNGEYLSGAFSYNSTAHIEFDAEGYKQTYENLVLDVKIPLWNLNYIKFIENGAFFEGRHKDYKTDLIYGSNKFSMGIGNIHTSGPCHFDKAGIEFSSSVENNIVFKASDFNANNKYSNVSFDLVVMDSSIIPVGFEATLFPENNYFAAAMVKAVLFNKEIQGAANWFSILYFNRIAVKGYYTAKILCNLDSWAVAEIDNYFSETKKDYADEACVSLSLYMTPNIGGLARQNFQTALTGSFKYRFFPEPDQNNFAFTLGFGLVQQLF